MPSRRAGETPATRFYTGGPSTLNSTILSVRREKFFRLVTACLFSIYITQRRYLPGILHKTVDNIFSQSNFQDMLDIHITSIVFLGLYSSLQEGAYGRGS
jgi:hypothetical protein